MLTERFFLKESYQFVTRSGSGFHWGNSMQGVDTKMLMGESELTARNKFGKFIYEVCWLLKQKLLFKSKITSYVEKNHI